MKKFFKKFAMILFCMVIVCSFTNCLSWFLMTGEWPDYGHVSGKGALGLIFLPVIDIALLPVALVVCIARVGIEAARDDRGKKYDSIDTFSASVSYIPEAELDFLMERFDSLPKAEYDSFKETINSFSERELAAINAAFNNLSEEEITSSLITLNSMPEEALIAALDSVQQIDFRYKY